MDTEHFLELITEFEQNNIKIDALLAENDKFQNMSSLQFCWEEIILGKAIMCLNKAHQLLKRNLEISEIIKSLASYQ